MIVKFELEKFVEMGIFACFTAIVLEIWLKFLKFVMKKSSQE